MREKSNERNRGKGGAFSPSDTPKKRQLCVSLSEPFITALDAYGEKNGTGRGGSIETLLQDVLGVSQRRNDLPPAQKDLVDLIPIKRSNPLYVKYREDHYIEDRGTVGQQIQYLITYGGRDVGVIGGASAVFANEPRDDYFSLSTIKDEKTVQLNSIINNNIFKLDFPAPNLATLVLSKWRRTIAQHWEYIYGVKVSGFETFVVEERLWDGRKRDGNCYRADNWLQLGITKGYGDTNVRSREVKSKTLQARKLVYGKKIKGIPLCSEYSAAWNDPVVQKQVQKRRDEIIKDDLDVLIQVSR
jgi:hypothetical protein